MQIGSKKINTNSAAYFIADIGANHDGDLARAKKLISLAAESGADACKFQHFSANTIVSETGFADIAKDLPSHQKSWKQSVVDVYRTAEISLEWDYELSTHCAEKGVAYMTSPYSIELLEHIKPYVDTIKIGSGDITWIEMLKEVGMSGKNILLATGASKIEDVIRAYNILSEYESPLCIMQCNTNYTGDMNNMQYVNLRVLKHYAEIFPDVLLGLSDHTPGFVTVLGAISLGAKIIEKHFTDSNSRSGPDHAFAMNPGDWSEMVNLSRLLESSLGDGVKKVEANEEKTYIAQRRSIYATRDIEPGEKIKESDLICLRPQQTGAYQAWEYNQLIGKKMRVRVKKDQCIFPTVVD